MQEPEIILTLAETTGLLRRIAEVVIRERGAYYCTVEGKRVKIVRAIA